MEAEALAQREKEQEKDSSIPVDDTPGETRSDRPYDSFVREETILSTEEDRSNIDLADQDPPRRPKKDPGMIPQPIPPRKAPAHGINLLREGTLS